MKTGEGVTCGALSTIYACLQHPHTDIHGKELDDLKVGDPVPYQMDLPLTDDGCQLAMYGSCFRTRVTPVIVSVPHGWCLLRRLVLDLVISLSVDHPLFPGTVYLFSAADLFSNYFRSADQVHAGGLLGLNGGCAFRLHFSLPMVRKHCGTGHTKTIEWKERPSQGSQYYSHSLLRPDGSSFETLSISDIRTPENVATQFQPQQNASVPRPIVVTKSK